MAADLISRAEAKAKGLKRYFTGKPCKHGHIALRITANGVCSICSIDIEKRWNTAHPEKLRRKRRLQAARHRRDNPSRIKRNKDKWVHANPDKVALKTKRWQTANPEKVRAAHKRWADAHRDHIRRKNKTYKTAHRDRLKPFNDARAKRWRKDNPEKVWKLTNARRARENNAPGSHTGAQLVELLKRQNFKCVECFTSLERKRHLDHIVPLSRGGSNDISNLQWLCPSCNCSKHDKDPIEWARERGRLL